MMLAYPDSVRLARTHRPLMLDHRIAAHAALARAENHHAANGATTRYLRVPAAALVPGRLTGSRVRMPTFHVSDLLLTADVSSGVENSETRDQE